MGSRIDSSIGVFENLDTFVADQLGVIATYCILRYILTFWKRGQTSKAMKQTSNTRCPGRQPESN